jgi:hypothetical protein
MSSFMEKSAPPAKASQCGADVIEQGHVLIERFVPRAGVVMQPEVVNRR